MTFFTPILIALLATYAAPADQSERPNIVLILADDMGYDRAPAP